MGSLEIWLTRKNLISVLKQELCEQFNICDKEHRKIMKVLAPQIQQIYQICKDYNMGEDYLKKHELAEIAALFSPTVIFLARNGQVEGLVELAKFAIKCTRAAYGDEHLETAKAESDLFYVYMIKGYYGPAEVHGEEALSIRKQILGINDKLTLSSLHYLANIYNRSMKFKRALKLYKKAASAGDYQSICEIIDLGRLEPELVSKKEIQFWKCKLMDRGAPKSQPYFEYGRIDFTPLHHAVQDENSECIRSFVEFFSPFVNHWDKDGQTPLHLAAVCGDMEIVKLLLEKYDANAEIKNFNGATPVHLAARYGHIEVMRILLDHCSANMNVKDKCGSTPVLEAARGEHIGSVKFLLERYNADVNIKNNHGESVLHLASGSGHTELVKLLVKEYGADAKAKAGVGRVQFCDVGKSKYPELMEEVMVACGAYSEFRLGWMPIHFAATGGHTEIVKFLLEIGNIDAKAKDIRGQSLLHLAARGGHMEVANLLLEELMQM
ncbi:uncharacterized protein VTP21DRAFT_8154 [Calcarisporiella thermophila]|uniref:uncharacterized protein n=1 Tax=Calcarisporiella thermophila TaxID=911321 RepID=UPI0037445190